MPNSRNEVLDLTLWQLYELSFALTLPRCDERSDRFTKEQRAIASEANTRIWNLTWPLAFGHFDPTKVSIGFVLTSLGMIREIESTIINTDKLKRIALLHKEIYEQIMQNKEEVLKAA